MNVDFARFEWYRWVEFQELGMNVGCCCFSRGCERIIELHVLHEGVHSVSSTHAFAIQAWLTNVARSQDEHGNLHSLKTILGLIFPHLVS